MYWLFRNLRFLFLASTMEFVTANDQCRTEVNIQGMAFKRSVFKRWSVATPHLCDVNFLSAPSWFYIRRLTGRGKKSEVDLCFHRFSPHLANLVPSNLWLRNNKKKKTKLLIVLHLLWVLFLNYRRYPVSK